MGSQSSGRDVGNVPRIYVRYGGFIVRADICVPRAHAHAAWLLPWVEGLLRGATLAELQRDPPWPRPTDAVIERYLLHTLIDLGWVTPTWSGTGVSVSAALTEAWRQGGRPGLARVLFDADVVRGEWWADGLGGVLLSRTVAGRFDWDGRRRFDQTFAPRGDILGLIDAEEPDLTDLIRKLGAVEALAETRDHAFLATPFVVEEPKDLLFPLFGEEVRVLPDELAELEPTLRAHGRGLLGEKRGRESRVVQLPASPIEPVLAEIERLPAQAVALGPIGPVRERVARLRQAVDSRADAMASWLSGSVQARAVMGPTQRQFNALAEVCEAIPDRGVVLLTSAFLNPENASQDDGIAEAMGRAPDGVHFLLVYGHANDHLPAQQQRDAEAWLEALFHREGRLRGRVHVTLGKRRSHEKVLLTSLGDWMLGSWNAASSRPNATVFEASLSGRDRRFASELLEKVAPNIEDDRGRRLVGDLARALGAADDQPFDAAVVVRQLGRAIGLVERAVPEEDGARAAAWAPAIRALRAAALPLQSRARLQLVDEQQTRDALVASVSAARRDVLMTSDRLVEGGLDRAMLRDLRGDLRVPPTLRVVWGREWAGRRASDADAGEQLRRARRAILAARDAYGDALLASEKPMENHAKLLVADGVRGLLTSENLLSYGGEKDSRESRELGVLFWSASVGRHLLGRAILRWPHVLSAALARRVEPPLAWAVAGNEAWHALAGLADELDFDWKTQDFVRATVDAEVVGTSDDTDEDRERRAEWSAIGQGPAGFAYVKDDGERLGLMRPVDAWSPWDADEQLDVEAPFAAAEQAVAALPVPRVTTPGPRAAEVSLIERVLAEMVRIPAGAFWMGDDRVPDERPRHRVHITRPFLLGRTPVNQDLWLTVMGSLPHLRDKERHPNFPIIQVTHAEMMAFVERLNAAPGGGGFELPTEAQWEYACRAGSDGDYCFGNAPGVGSNPGRLERFAWTQRNAQGRLHGVGELEPNRWGLYDMHGLVYEACRDPMRTFQRGEVRDPVGRPGEGKIAARGGSCGRFPLDPRDPEQEHFRCASRQWAEKSHRVSFRLARRLEEK
jgi:formylglycine-generating enzyme required for sulfatase activity